jgi:hypothetical protein
MAEGIIREAKQTRESLHLSQHHGQECWLTPLILALGILRQEDPGFEASLGYIARTCQKKRKEGRKEERKRKEIGKPTIIICE